MNWLKCAALAFVLHLSWEMADMPLYRGTSARPWWEALLPCARAALFDVVLTLATSPPAPLEYSGG